MRQVVVDTETTGLDVSQGHRIIEIGCVELINRRKTERHFHQYINPQREIDDGAFEVHGISNADLKDKPAFGEVAGLFLDFVRDAELIIHNAPFDVEFINNELQLLGPEWGRLEDYCTVSDTLSMARERHPGQKNNLDALCTRYAVDNSQRDLHGALLDAQLLLDVYLAMMSGLGEDGRAPLKVIRPSAAELKAHRDRLEVIDGDSGGRCLWRREEEVPD